jgi:hypothetical protein
MYKPKENSTSPAHAVAAGAAFFGVVAFFAAGFLGAAFLAGVVLLVVLVTRPDLVLPRTAGLSTTAGAYSRWLEANSRFKAKILRQQ